MDFAKKLLHKYGWKEGDGLGKSMIGAVKPIKASLKFDNAGLGSDPASDFNNFWWERVFNEATQNVEVKAQKDGLVCLDLKNQDDSVEITTKEYSSKKLKKSKQAGRDLGYGNFLKSSVLTESGGEVLDPERILTDDIAVSRLKTLTDEELFRACGGRTAHKGAGHGLKMSGKLLRLEQQEQELLAAIRNKKDKLANVRNDGNEQILPIKKIKKSKMELVDTETVEIPIPLEKLKKKKSKVNISSPEPETVLATNDQQDELNNAQKDSKPAKSDRKKNKLSLDESNEMQIPKTSSSEFEDSVKKKKRKSERQETVDLLDMEQESQPAKKIKRIKPADPNSDEFTHKKCKKSKKEKTEL